MGVRNYLIEGGSGVGKTSVAEELERRGHEVVHGDRTLAYYGDPVSGVPISHRPYPDEASNLRWACDHWIWPVETVRRLAVDRSRQATFFCGHSANNGQFIDLFDLVFTLEVDVDTLDGRLLGRASDEFGGRPVERDIVVEMHASRSGLPENALRIDAKRSIVEIVDEILAYCGLTSER